MIMDGRPPTTTPLYRKPETRIINKVFLHCSASGLPEHARVDVIDMWHRKRGFDEIGYHYFIDFEGKIWHGRDIEKKPAAQKGHNTGSVAICLAGLRQTDCRVGQLDSLIHLCYEINHAHNGNVTFHGHCEVSNKSCPVFDYKHYLKLDADGVLGGNRTDITAALELFDTGVAIVQLQRQLNHWLGSNGKRMVHVDGVFGNETAQAVIDFQIANDLPPTGRVDSLTKLQLPILVYHGGQENE